MTAVVFTAQIMTVASFFLSALAAYFWYKSATVKVKSLDVTNEDGWYPSQIITEGNVDFLPSIRKQSQWAVRGAYAAMLAALSQGSSMLLPLLFSS